MTRYRCDCGCFLKKKATKVVQRKERRWCDGRTIIIHGRLSHHSPVDRAILLIKGNDHKGDAFIFERLAPCNETGEKHKPHQYITDKWYDHIRICARCGMEKRWWSYAI